MSRGRRRLQRGLIGAALLIAVLAGGAIAFAGRHVKSEQTAYSGPSAPRCVPQHLDVSAQLPGTQLTVSPLPGSYDAMPQTQISMLGVPAGDISGVQVVGSQTGRHSGRLEAYSQGDGASFLPAKPFQSGETVTVHGRLRTGSGSRPFSFHFTVAYPDPVAHHPPTPRPPAEPGEVLHFHSAKWLEPPAIDITYHSSEVAPGDIFIAPYSGASQEGPMIISGSGQLIWMHPLPPGIKATNFQVETYEGKPVLTWWQGYIPPQGFGEGEEIVESSSYRTIMRIHAGNGDMADLHDFHLEPHNTAVMTVFRTIHCNLTSDNGPRDSALTDGLFQEIDLKTGLVRREWDSVNHVPLGLSDSLAVQASTGWPFDFFHINTVDPRANGTTLISSRNTSALYVLNDKTGQIEMEIGGKKSSVTVEEGAATAYQHDAMTLPNGDISIFDNGGAPFYPEGVGQKETRGLIVEVNAQAKTDRLLQEFKHPTPLKAGSQGDVQPLQNGDWFMGWGQEPYFTEYSSSGRLLFDAHMASKVISSENKTPYKEESYRTYKFPWEATPWYPPSIAAEPSEGGLQVWASWNGATNVASWRVLGGETVGSLSPLATVQSSGFETGAHVPSRPYIEVQALDSSGAVIGNSKTIEPTH